MNLLMDRTQGTDLVVSSIQLTTPIIYKTKTRIILKYLYELHASALIIPWDTSQSAREIGWE